MAHDCFNVVLERAVFNNGCDIMYCQMVCIFVLKNLGGFLLLLGRDTKRRRKEEMSKYLARTAKGFWIDRISGYAFISFSLVLVFNIVFKRHARAFRGRISIDPCEMT